MSEFNYTRRKYTSHGVFLFSETFDPLVQWVPPAEQSGTDVYNVHDDGQMEIQTAFRSQVIKATYTLAESLIEDGGFDNEAWINTTLINWGGTASIAKVEVNQKNKDFAVQINGNGSNFPALGSYIESKPLGVFAEDTSLRVSYEYKLATPQNITAFINVMIKVGNYYLSNNDGWTLQAVAYQVAVNNWREFVKVEFVSPPIVEDGELIVRLYQPSKSVGESRQSGPVLYNNVNISLIIQDKDPVAEEEYVWMNQSGKYTFQPEPVELLHADVPDTRNSNALYPYALRFNGQPTKLWARVGYSEQKKIQEILLEYYKLIHNRPRQKINVTLFSKGQIGLLNYVQHEINNFRAFMIKSVSVNDADCEYQVELLEVNLNPSVENFRRVHEDGAYRLHENNDFRSFE